MSQKTFVPLPVPSAPADCKPSPELTATEDELYSKVLAHFSNPEYVIPGLAKGQLKEEEKFWLSRECIIRFLRAVKWATAEKAIERLEETLKWRREFGLYDLVTADLVEPEAVTGKEILFGHDTSRRPAFYMIPSRQNTTEAERQIQYAVWMLERTFDLMGPGVESLDLMINFADRAKNPSLGTARTVLSILQNHYPERLGLAIIINIPFLVNAFFKLISPFIDPVTRAKMKFNSSVLDEGIFTPDMLMKEWWGGDVDFEYEHEKYWPALVSQCKENEQKWTARWKSLGGVVGVREWDYKTRNDSPSSASATAEKILVSTTVAEVQEASPVAVA
ncbi:CRAL/TRIO domain-containing protein [Pleurotus eryngii]|uniref:CRAL/TRIO domain-containing protein n=1 Tax=Pleurotus eryngii TaxID=5323 RepID=A0A9P6A0Y8_PLEER|nr:CRAL/TRIO domain-containing protein [Pleurotus eryngii]